MMDAEAIKRIEDLVRAGDGKTVEIGGVTYSTRTLWDPRTKENEPDALKFFTLQALVDYVSGGIDGAYLGELGARFVHVWAPGRVSLKTQVYGEFRQRLTAAVVEFDAPDTIKFGHWYDSEEFVIRVMSGFEDTIDRARLLELVGNLKDEAVAQWDDDGITQKTTVRKGATLGATPVLNPFGLRPFRTFPEVDQPESPFILRLRGGSAGAKPPTVSLHECDGGAWRLDAVALVKAWLATNLPESRIYG